MTNEEREAAAASRREARVALREKISRLERERDEALEQLAEVHEKTIDALLDIIDAERKKFKRERDELASQLAALREAATEVRAAEADVEAHEMDWKHDEQDRASARLEAGRNALAAAISAAAAPAVEAYKKRVQSEALESEFWGPVSHRRDPYQEWCNRWFRDRAVKLRGGQ